MHSLSLYCDFTVKDSAVSRPNAGASVSARRFGDALHIACRRSPSKHIVHRNTLSRQPASESVQRFLREALRVIRARRTSRVTSIRRSSGTGTNPCPCSTTRQPSNWYRMAGLTTCYAMSHRSRRARQDDRHKALSKLTAYRMHVPKWAAALTALDLTPFTSHWTSTRPHGNTSRFLH